MTFGLLFPQSTFATGHHSDKWDSFCKPDKWPEKPVKKWYGGDCDEIFVQVKLPKIWKSIEGNINVEVYWSETGKVRDARPIASGTLELEAGKEGEFTHKPGKSGYYWFNLSKEGKRKTRRTKKIKVDCPEQPGEGGQPAEPPQNGGEDEQPGGTGTDDQVKPDDERSKGEDNSGEIPNHKSGQGGGKLPKTATSHPQSMWSAVCFSWRERGSWSSVGASPRPAPPSASRRGLLVGRPFLCWKIGILSRG